MHIKHFQRKIAEEELQLEENLAFGIYRQDCAPYNVR